MNLLINTSNLQSGGAIQVALSILEEWQQLNTQHCFFVILSPQVANQIHFDAFDDRFSFFTIKQNPSHSFLAWWHFRKTIKIIERNNKIDAAFSVFGPALWRPSYKHVMGFANGFYLFDKSKFIQKWLTISNKTKYKARQALLLKRLQKEADYVWTETEESKNTLLKKTNLRPNNIHVIGNTYNKHLRHTSTTLSKSETFSFLYISAYYPHKNFEIFVKVAALLKAANINCQFIFTLPENDFSNIFGSSATSSYFKNIGPVAFSNLQETYEQCHAIIMPSLLETSSANFPEAMQCRKPILASDIPSAQIACGDAALYFDPNQAQDIVEKIQLIIQDTELQNRLIQNGIERLKQIETPQSRAYKVLSIIENTAK